MAVDSKTVNKAIKAIIWPALKCEGFSHFTTRTAYRYSDTRIEVVNFQSMGSHWAAVTGLPSHSFAVNLGTYPLNIPPRWPCKVKDGRQVPDEAECPFRGCVARTISQPGNHKESLWIIDESGKGLNWCMQDVLLQLPSVFTWFARLRSDEELLRILMNENEKFQVLWGFGSNPSPIRSYLAGYIALRLGQMDLAKEKLQEAIDTKLFTHLFSSVEGALSRAL